MKYVASIDQGTSSTRVVVYDSDFRTVRVATRHLKTHAPQPGWLEMHGSDILSSVEACLEEACAGLEISCVGIANQRETTLALDSQTGEALSPAILWSDTRTADICEEWKKQENSGWLLQQTGLPFSPYFSASKMLWLLKNNEAVQQSAVEGRLAFATVDAYLLRHLTGVLSTDGTNASRTMLMGLKELAWSSEAVSFCGVGAFQLPQLKPSIGDFGEIVRGPLKGVRVTGVLGDQQAALLGQGCTREGESKCTFGTGAFLLQHVGGEPHEGAAETGLVSTVAVHRQEQGKTT
jgi:glycerol kinase